MKNKHVLSIFLGILFIISSVVAINFYLKYSALNEQWNQYTDYGEIKLKLPIDTTTEAIVVASSSSDFNDFINSDIDYYYVTPKLSGEEYSLTFTGRYDNNSDGKLYYFAVSKSGELKTDTDFRAERDATR